MKDTSDHTRLECPGCGGFSFTTNPDGSLTCDCCRATYVSSGQPCPECAAVVEPGARHCPACGAELVRECLACGAQNPPSARRCVACGKELEVLEALFTRVTGVTADRLRQQGEEAAAIKAQQETASQARLAQMWVTEERRRQVLAQAQAKRDRQQRMMWSVAVAVFIIIALIIIVAIVMNSFQSPYFYPR